MQAQPYTQKQKSQIEKVRTVFSGYIQNSPYIDLLWSKKLGYLLVSVNPEAEKGSALESDPLVIKSAEMLCDLLLNEILLDVINSSGKGHDCDDPDEEECAEIQKRLRPYMEQLPEYERLAGELFS